MPDSENPYADRSAFPRPGVVIRDLKKPGMSGLDPSSISLMGDAPRLTVVHHAPHGVDAIDYLKGLPPYSDRQNFPLPDVLLLDLKMPFADGFEVLQWLEKNLVAGLHVFVLSASELPEDIGKAHALGADAYFVKPSTSNDLRRIVAQIESWIGSPKELRRFRPDASTNVFSARSALRHRPY